jgi:hypothetical protein
MDIRVKESLLIAGISAATIYLTMPRGKKTSKIKKPDTADKSEVTQKENARIALDAYINAVDAKENARVLQQLNNQLASTYGLRVYKQGQYFVAKDSSGKEILYAK